MLLHGEDNAPKNFPGESNYFLLFTGDSINAVKNLSVTVYQKETPNYKILVHYSFYGIEYVAATYTPHTYINCYTYQMFDESFDYLIVR